ncbi:MAG: hypothetical protein KKH94_02495 [Candidatus Omnitrophica bacterium]|nr:hypothetical protein [Candidatus Omnitrophota bacterium]
MIKRVVCLLLVSALVCGCETTLNETQSGTLAGSALGAGLGAIIGNQTGHAGAGTAIGAGAGALAGGLIGEGIRRQKTPPASRYQQPVPTRQPVGQIQEIHTKFCPTCGKTYPESDRFCSEDGTELRYIE